jgi:hypothetical protein
LVAVKGRVELRKWQSRGFLDLHVLVARELGEEIRMAVKEGWRGRFFDDFEVGDVYEHPLGRTVTTTDNAWFTLLT